MLPLVLASSSTFRKSLLEKLQLSFECASPDINEIELPNEQASDLVVRLAQQKSQVLAAQFPAHLIIGSDQVAVCNGKILGKPHGFENAFKQLKESSGQVITFYTGLSLHNTKTLQTQSLVETFNVHFRHLSDDQITAYLHKEEPYQCAGSFKSEGLGISLFESLEGRDPNTLVGLPLISLIDLLANEGVFVLG
jgi:MAF protein